MNDKKIYVEVPVSEELPPKSDSFPDFSITVHVYFEGNDTAYYDFKKSAWFLNNGFEIKPEFWLRPTDLSELIREVAEALKVVEYIERNNNKINEHTWKVYKEQISSHVEDLRSILNSFNNSLPTKPHS